MEQEVVKIIRIETDGAAKTVKDLKNEIKYLRDDLVNTEKGTKEYDEIVKQLTEDQRKLTDVMNAGKSTYSAVDDSIKGLRNELKSLNNTYDELSAADRNSDVGKNLLQQIQDITTQLKELEGETGRFQRSVGDYENAIKKVTGEYVTQKQELKALKVELEQLEPGTDAYNEKFMRAAEITHNLQEQQTMLKYSSTDLGDQLSNLRGIAANMAAGFSAANAAIGLFGGESKEVQKAMLKVQQAMALVQGLQGLDGFIKRTTGLSNAMKKWFTSTKEVTVATNTLSTAEKANAAATNAQTVATEGATVAQKGLNAAMKANPIGLILGLLALLVANWKKVTEWLGKAVGGWDKVTKAMNKFKAAAAGVANVIKKVLLVPIKETINYFATLGKVIGDVFTGNWKNIGEDIKNGVTNAVDIVKDGYNVAANYAAGKEAEITRQIEVENKKRAEAHAKELDEYIKDMEAKEGADWKYTEEGKQYYTDYFNTLMQMYKKDSEEYKEAQRDKWSYDREYQEKKDKADKDAAKAAEDARKKAADAAKKAQDELLKIETNYQNKVAKTIGTSYKQVYTEFRESVDSFADYFNKLAKEIVPPDKELSEWIKGFNKAYATHVENIFEKNNETIIRETKALLNGLSSEEIKNVVGESYFEKYFEGLDDEKITSRWKTIVATLGDKTGLALSDAIKMRMNVEASRLNKQANVLLNDVMMNSSTEANKKINDTIINLFQKTILPRVDDELARLQMEIDKKTIKIDFELETGFNGDEWIDNEELVPLQNFDRRAAELERATEVYQNAMQQLLVQRNYYQQTVDYVNDNALIPSEEYDAAIIRIEELDNQLNQLHVNYYKTNAEIRDRYFAQDIQTLQEKTATELRTVEDNYNKLYTEGSNYYNYRVAQTGVLYQKDIEAAEEAYNVQKSSLEQQLGLYQSYLQDVTVAGDQRVEAEKMVAELIAEIEEGEVAHTIEMNKLRGDAWNQYYSMVNEGVQGIGSIIGSLTDYYEADIKARLEANEITQDAAEKEFETVKGWRVAEAVINTIAGSIGAYLQATAAYPPPAGEIIGAISAAAVAAAGWAQVANIKRQKLGSSSTSQSPAATPQMSSYTPEIIENPTQNNEMENLRNSFYSQPIKAYVVESDITDAQKVANTRKMESSF